LREEPKLVKCTAKERETTSKAKVMVHQRKRESESLVQGKALQLKKDQKRNPTDARALTRGQAGHARKGPKGRRAVKPYCRSSILRKIVHPGELTKSHVDTGMAGKVRLRTIAKNDRGGGFGRRGAQGETTRGIRPGGSGCLKTAFKEWGVGGGSRGRRGSRGTEG